MRDFIEYQETVEEENFLACAEHRGNMGLTPDIEEDPEFVDCDCSECITKCPLKGGI